jgi:transcriptional regulator with XRE-family HTH domain
MTAAPSPAAVGELLRSWRQRRSVSQLELSLNSAVSARHLSFIETGRARPSREMVLHLAEQLDVPLRERNRLLVAAGFAPLYAARSLDDDDMAPARNALERFLRAHEPYPAVVVDGHWNLVAGNDAVELLTAGVAAELFEPPANTLRIALHPQGMAPHVVNFEQWSAHLLERLRRRAVLTADGELESLYRELAAYPGVATRAPERDGIGEDIVLPLELLSEGGSLTFLSTISTFGTAHDITLAELSIEALYPADDATAAALQAPSLRGQRLGD